MTWPADTVKQVVFLSGWRTLCVGVSGLAVLALAGAMAWYTAVIALRMDSPEFVLGIAPADGVAQSLVLDHTLTRWREMPADRIDKAGLRAALRQDPLQAPVLRLLATADVAQLSPGSLALLRQAHAVSRHDLGTEIGLIEADLSHNDIAGALRHYDAALSTHEEARAQLFPLLAQALNYEDVRRGVKDYIARPANWTGAFLDYAADHARADGISLVLSDSASALTANDLSMLRHKIFTRLIGAGAYPEAFALVGQIVGPALDQFQSMDINADTANPALRPFSWALPGRDIGPASLLPDRGAVIEVAVNKVTTALSRTLLLPAGNYDFAANIAFSADDPTIMGIWEWRCIDVTGRDRSIARLTFPAKRAPATLGMEVPVPEDCRALVVNLLVAAGDAPTGRQVAVYAVGLREHHDGPDGP